MHAPKRKTSKERKRMFKNKSSVSISIEGNEEKNLRIPTILIKYWQYTLTLTILIISMIVGSISYLAAVKNSNTLKNQYEATIDKVNTNDQQTKKVEQESQQDIIEAKKSLNQIDSALESINAKMKKRGLSTIALSNMGGPIESDKENINLLSKFYKEKLLMLEKRLATTPLGKPHPGEVTSGFGYRTNPFTNSGREMHYGVDIRGTIGQPIRSTADGTISFAGFEGEYGYVVKIKHDNDFETRYAHLVRTLVKPGQKVEAGAVVGLLGNTGRSTGPHLHYEIIKNDEKLDPEKYFSF